MVTCLLSLPALFCWHLLNRSLREMEMLCRISSLSDRTGTEKHNAWGHPLPLAFSQPVCGIGITVSITIVLQFIFPVPPTVARRIVTG